MEQYAEQLQEAIDKGDLNKVKELFTRNGPKLCSAYVEWDKQRRETPVHRAINQDQSEIALFLLQLRKSQVQMMIKHADFRGETPLHRCGWCGRVSVASKLLKLGAKPQATNSLGLTPLHLAAEREKIDVVDLLIKFKANVNAQSNQGNTPLHRAMTTQNEAVIGALIRAGADPEILNHKSNRAGGQYTATQLQQFKSTKVDKSRSSLSSKSREKKTKSKEKGIEAKNSARFKPEDAKLSGIDSSFYEIKPERVIYGPKIGEGGFGTVYEGTESGQPVALKQLTGSNARIHENFRKELDMMCGLRHPNIVLLLGAVIQPDQLCFVMELCKGGSLVSLLKHRELNVSEVVFIAKQIALAMNWLHSRSPPILHLDLKPANILLADLHSLHVKVSDFGLARPSKPDSKAIVGTRRFMAPEMMRKLPVTEKADVYSFGVLLWEIYTGKKPFQQFKTIKTQQEKKEFGDAVWNGARPPISLTAPPLLGNLIHRCWSTDPSKRPSFSEIIQWLDRVISSNAFSDPSAQVFWDLATSESQDITSIRWKLLRNSISNVIGDNHSAIKYLSQILSNPQSSQSDLVHINRFSSLIHCFAPFHPIEEFANRLISLCELNWKSYKQDDNALYPVYYPFTERDSATALLVGRPSGTFIIRNSSTNNSFFPFTITHVSEQQIKNTNVGYNSHTKQFNIAHIFSSSSQLISSFLSSSEVLEFLSLKYATIKESDS